VTARPLAGAEHAQQLLDMLRRKGASPGPAVRPRDAAPVLSLVPLEADAAITATRAPDAAPLAHPPALDPPRGGEVSRELAALRVELARVLVVVAGALESNDARALLEALDALEGVRSRERRFVTVVVGESWREHREPLFVAQNIGAAIGVLARAVDLVRRGTW
jgi:hypothetical protein